MFGLELVEIGFEGIAFVLVFIQFCVQTGPFGLETVDLGLRCLHPGTGNGLGGEITAEHPALGAGIQSHVDEIVRAFFQHGQARPARYHIDLFGLGARLGTQIDKNHIIDVSDIFLRCRRLFRQQGSAGKQSADH
jgi:hypothetical protein